MMFYEEFNQKPVIEQPARCWKTCQVTEIVKEMMNWWSAISLCGRSTAEERYQLWRSRKKTASLCLSYLNLTLVQIRFGALLSLLIIL